jgi:hypothetical protein
MGMYPEPYDYPLAKVIVKKDGNPVEFDGSCLKGFTHFREFVYYSYIPRRRRVRLQNPQQQQ